MNYKEAIVVIPVENVDNGRELAEKIEGAMFGSVREVLTRINVDGAAVYSLSNFMDLCNDEAFNCEHSWITIVKIATTQSREFKR